MTADSLAVPQPDPASVDNLFRRGQLVSAGLYSLGHGTNDAQKTMGIIAGLLFTVPAYRHLVTDASGGLVIPFWIVLMAHAAIALGTLSGGWRIVHTMGSKITKLVPMGGFAAETAGAITLFASTAWASRSRRLTSSPAPSSASARSSGAAPCAGASRGRSCGPGC